MKEQLDRKEYDAQYQELLISFMLADSDGFARSQNIIKADYFEDRLKPTVNYVLDYASKYRVLPTYEQVGALTKLTLPPFGADDVERHRPWYFEEIEQFCRHKALERVVLSGLDLIETGRYSEIERGVKEAMTISLQKDLGTDYFADPLGRLQRMRDRSNYISTGWSLLDRKLYGGFARRTLNVFAGGPGSGKSLFLQNLALNYALGGYNVVYFTLELSEDLVSMRLDAMVSGMSTKDIWKRLDEVDLKVRLIGRDASSVRIKKMPEGGTTATDLRAYLKEYEIKTGIRPDVVIVDYLDLMHPNSRRINPSDLFVKDKYTSEEMRSLADELDAIFITASQLNRQSVEMAGNDYNQSHIAGGMSKINTADNLIAIHINYAMRERGEYVLQFLKTRTAAAQDQKITMKFDQATLRISDPDPADDPGQKRSTLDQIKGRLNSRLAEQPAVIDSGAEQQLRGMMEAARP